MKMFNAAVEVALKGADLTNAQADELMDAVAGYSGSVGTSPRGWLELRISLPALNLAQASSSALAVIEQAAGAAAIASEILLEDEWLARQGFTPEPELVNSSEAAELLGVSQQRVRQLADAGRLQVVPWEGRAKAYTRSSVLALASQDRHGGRPRKRA